jgi:uncharacterized protein (DUF488 family)
MRTIFTVGHSTHPIEHFISLLKTHQINCLVDVRSVAASRFNPQYNKQKLSDTLKDEGIAYLHFAEEFGARKTDPALMDEGGKVDFEKVRTSKEFISGIDRLKQGIEKGFRIALMCAEAQPLDCHRFCMISPALQEEGFEVLHILKDKTLLGNKELEQQLLLTYSKKLFKRLIYPSDISLEQNLKAAYRWKNKQMGYKPE